MYPAIFFFISLAASTLGAICGVGGGVIIKPLLDFLSLTDVSSVSFLSACTVLMMTAFSVTSELRKKDSKIDLKNVTPLAMGAAVGGVLGKLTFEKIKGVLPFADMVGAYQAVVLGLVAVGTLLYTANKGRIKTRKLSNPAFNVLFGTGLGCMSSFLGIGGGPVDLVVLYYFFSMDTRAAVQNSLFIIFISQFFGLGYTVLSGAVPDVSFVEIAVMSAGGIAGGIVGRKISRKIKTGIIDRLFMLILLLIIMISIYNFFVYSR